jgi:two-component sensor histidine kinase
MRRRFNFRHYGEPMLSKPSTRVQSETIDERTIRLLHDEISQLHGQAGRANDREVDLAASLLAAETRLLDSGAMLHEVNHRAKNSIQIAMSLLGLQMHATKSEEVRLELANAIRRLGNIAAAHLMLNSQSSDEQRTSFRAYLTLICTETHQSLGGDRIALIINADELALDTSRAINLALIASEALTNAMKYAFPNGRRGTIRVDFHHDHQVAALTIADDGAGFAATSREGALGLRLVRTLARAIGGEAEIDGSSGTQIKVRFKL